MSTLQQRRENRKAGRLELEKPLKVVMGSIGAQVKYTASTRNVSYSGIFLLFDNPRRFPFTNSSILEVWVELDANDSLFFNGKLARVVHKEETNSYGFEPGIAIHIVQIDQENEKKLFHFIDDNLMKQKEKKGKIA